MRVKFEMEIPSLLYGEWNFRSGSSLTCVSGCVVCESFRERRTRFGLRVSRTKRSYSKCNNSISTHNARLHICLLTLVMSSRAAVRLSLSEFTESSGARPRWGTDGRGSRLTSDPLRSLHAWTQITIIRSSIVICSSLARNRLHLRWFTSGLCISCYNLHISMIRIICGFFIYNFTTASGNFLFFIESYE
jgi:hypothetical protein